MLLSYLKVAWRSFRRQLGFSLINLLSLTIGLTCALLIYVWVQHELSVDQYHQHKRQLYQTFLRSATPEGSLLGMQPTVSPATSGYLKDQHPEVMETARAGFPGELVFRMGDRVLLESRGLAVEPSYFDLFTVSFLKGDKQSVFRDRYSLILTESMAEKYFGTADPTGKTIRIQERYDFTVTGVIRNFPKNASQSFEFLVPYEFLGNLGQDIRGERYSPCDKWVFAMLREDANLAQLNARISADMLWKPNETTHFDLTLYPYSKVYLLNSNGNVRITVLSGIALLILLIACMNFTNLATARAVVRIKEIGMRKVTGATRQDLMLQFLGESLLMTSVALLLALVCVDLVLIPINRGMDLSLAIPFTDPIVYVVLPALALVTALTSGFYPALYLSRFRPTEVLKQGASAESKAGLRTILIVCQFVVSIVFVIATLIAQKQIDFMQHFDLGVNKSNIVMVPLEGDVREKSDLLKQRLSTIPQISAVATADQMPTAVDGMGFSYERWGTVDAPDRRLVSLHADADYLKVFGMVLSQGRFYDETLSSDGRDTIVVNETALQQAGPEMGLGQPFFYRGKLLTVVGVVHDFQQDQGLTSKPIPMVIRHTREGSRYLFIKIDPAIQASETLLPVVDAIRSICHEFSPGRPLRYQFLSEFSLKTERDMVQTRQILFFSSLLAIVIANVGLLGLSAFIITRRTKEIGIRKVVGASVTELVTLLTRDFTKWILFANGIAWPIAWIVMQRWLEHYAYRTPVTLTPFLMAGLGALLLAVLTICWQAIRAANLNPVENLRYE